jgi:hypothetical protein
MPKKTTSAYWSFDSVVSWMEECGEIAPPFSPQERALAHEVARAHYFAHTLTRLPGRVRYRSVAHYSVMHCQRF